MPLQQSYRATAYMHVHAVRTVQAHTPTTVATPLTTPASACGM